jgi:hypothetical protein
LQGRKNKTEGKKKSEGRKMRKKKGKAIGTDLK